MGIGHYVLPTMATRDAHKMKSGHASLLASGRQAFRLRMDLPHRNSESVQRTPALSPPVRDDRTGLALPEGFRLQRHRRYKGF